MRNTNDGPVCEGWQLSLTEGHSGFGVYAHMTEYPEEGSEFLVPVAKAAPPAPQPLTDEDIVRLWHETSWHDDMRTRVVRLARAVERSVRPHLPWSA